jgi:hypothetical protein
MRNPQKLKYTPEKIFRGAMHTETVHELVEKKAEPCEFACVLSCSKIKEQNCKENKSDKNVNSASRKNAPS